MGRGRDGRALSQDVPAWACATSKATTAGCARRRPRARCSSARVQTGFDEETGEPVFEDGAVRSSRRMPYIVVIIDEMADLMMVRGQGDRGRGAAPGADGAGGGHPPDHGDAAPVGGCHHRHDQGELPDADQLPGDVQDRQPHHPGRTGRRAAAGQGDMLYMAGGGRITRVHGPFVSDEEVEKIVDLPARAGRAGLSGWRA